MRRGRTRRFAVAVAVAAAVPMLGACGIRGTDVIEAGGPASFQAFLNRDTDMLLFFRAPDGSLAPVIRTVESSTEFGDGYSESGSGDAAEDPIPTEKVVLALLSGPRTEDRAAGLTSTLPTPAAAPPSSSTAPGTTGSRPTSPSPWAPWTPRPSTN